MTTHWDKCSSIGVKYSVLNLQPQCCYSVMVQHAVHTVQTRKQHGSKIMAFSILNFSDLLRKDAKQEINNFLRESIYWLQIECVQIATL